MLQKIKGEPMFRMKRMVLFCFIALTFGLTGTVSGALINMAIHGDTVVYDNDNNLYWYPILTEFTGMTLNEQLDAIEGLNYGGTSNWRMATWNETSLLKTSLSAMATTPIRPTEFGPDFPNAVTEDRTISSPFLAWDIDSSDYFTPTATFDFAMLNAEGMDVYNGRTNGWGMTNIGDGGFGGEVIWSDMGADDHWASVNLMNAGDENLTMIFNFDQHQRDPNALTNPVMGEIGAWVVSEPVPEPTTALLFVTGLTGLISIIRRRKK